MIAQAGGLIQGSTDITPDMMAELETHPGGHGVGPASRPVAPILSYRCDHVGAGHCHFCTGLWQDVGNLLADQLGPIPMATLATGRWGRRARIICVPCSPWAFKGCSFWCVLPSMRCSVQGIVTSGDPIGAIWGIVGYTVLLCFMLFKTGGIAQRIFGAH